MDRVDAAAGAGAGTIVAGKVGEEVARTSESVSIMELDILFGLMAPYELPLSGAIMIVGLAFAIGSFVKRGK